MKCHNFWKSFIEVRVQVRKDIVTIPIRDKYEIIENNNIGLL